MLWLVTGGRLSVRTPTVIVAIIALLFAVWQVREIVRTRPILEAWTIHDELAAWADSLTVFLIPRKRDSAVNRSNPDFFMNRLSPDTLAGIGMSCSLSRTTGLFSNPIRRPNTM